MKRTRPWELSDELWERVHPLIPKRTARPKGGRPAQSDRQMLSAILYVLRTGIQWNDCHGNWERARPSMIAFGSGKSKGCLSASGKAWMGYCGIRPFRWSRDRHKSHRSRQTGNEAQPVT